MLYASVTSLSSTLPPHMQYAMYAHDSRILGVCSVCTDASLSARHSQFTCLLDESSFIRIQPEPNNKFIHGSLANFRSGFIFLVMPCWLIATGTIYRTGNGSHDMDAECIYIRDRIHVSFSVPRWLWRTHTLTTDTHTNTNWFLDRFSRWSNMVEHMHTHVVSFARAININPKMVISKKGQRRRLSPQQESSKCKVNGYFVILFDLNIVSIFHNS